MERCYHITLDLYQEKNYSNLVFCQHDTGNRIVIQFEEKGVLIPLADKSAVVKLNDAYKLQTNIQGDTLRVPLDGSAVSQIGKNQLIVALYDGESALTVQKVYYQVKEGIGDMDNIPGQPQDETVMDTVINDLTAANTRLTALEAGKADKADTYTKTEVDERIINYEADMQSMLTTAEAYQSQTADSAKEAKSSADNAKQSELEAARQAVAASSAKDLALEAQNGSEISEDNALSAAQSASAAQAACNELYLKMMDNVTKFPRIYYKNSVAEMTAITDQKTDDWCFITDFNSGETQWYIYDTVDKDGNHVPNEWLLIGKIPYSVFDKQTLSSILDLAEVAYSGSYRDLSGRYIAPLVLDGTAEVIAYDFSQNENAMVAIGSDKPINITNMPNGAELSIYVSGGGLLQIPEEERSAAFGLLEPVGNQAMVYTAKKFADKMVWNCMPYGKA